MFLFGAHVFLDKKSCEALGDCKSTGQFDEILLFLIATTTATTATAAAATTFATTTTNYY